MIVKHPRVLFVDDEKNILDAIALTMRREYDVQIATSGAEALNILQTQSDFAVICSDMRMPNMNGAELLNKVKSLYPDITRIILTGEPGRDGVVDAVNDGQVFRFLTKPCIPAKLKTALNAAVIQHRLVCAERVLLQETLVGCIKALIDVLAITNPTSFGRANRVRKLAMDLSARMGHVKFWQLDAASMLSQIGYLSLPPELLEKMHTGQPLSPEERNMANGVPAVASKLLGHIPRIEPVLQILTSLNSPAKISALHAQLALGARILTLVLEYDALTQGAANTAQAAVANLRRQTQKHDADLVDKLAEAVGAKENAEEMLTVLLCQVKPGMIFVDEIRSDKGTLLIPAGFEVNDTLSERLRNYNPVLLATKVRVIVRTQKAPTPEAKNQVA